MRKREKFIISSILLAFGLVTTQLVPVEVRPLAIILFFIATYFISAWALSKTINGVEWLTIVPFPAMYALSVSLFYFLLPTNLASQAVIIILFGIGMYALYLSANIFSIGKLKTIQLLRAAHAVEFLFLLIMSLFLFNFIFSLHLMPILNGFFVGVASFLPILCSLWSIVLSEKLPRRIVWISIFFALILGEVAFIISLLPVGLWTASLYLTSLLYVGFGIIQHHLVGRLFTKTLREYLWLGGFVTISFMLLIDWK